MSLATFEDVTKFYGPVQALGPITLDIPQRSVGLLGPNGAGKTTMIRLLLGLMPPTSGSLKVLDEDVREAAVGLRRRIGYLPEGDTYFPDKTGVEAVAYAGRLSGMTQADAMQRAHLLLDYVELGEARYRLVEKYSTGMRQRLKLAQCLVHDPELVILDEPTEGVDPEARPRLLELIRDLEREHGLQLMISSHLLHDVEQLADHAVVLHQGRVVADGPIAELKRAPSEAYMVRANGPVEGLTGALEEAGVPYARMDPNVRVDIDDPREVLRVVRDAGLVVRHLAPAELSLEEAFEQAVRGGDGRA